MNLDLAVLPADQFFVGGFDPAEPVVVQADEAEQMRTQLPVGIETAALLQEADTLQVEVGDASRLVGRYLPAHVREVLLSAEPVGEEPWRSLSLQSPSASQSRRPLPRDRKYPRGRRRSCRHRRWWPARGRAGRGCHRVCRERRWSGAAAVPLEPSDRRGRSPGDRRAATRFRSPRDRARPPRRWSAVSRSRASLSPARARFPSFGSGAG
jgi:hypothetical protein